MNIARIALLFSLSAFGSGCTDTRQTPVYDAGVPQVQDVGVFDNYDSFRIPETNDAVSLSDTATSESDAGTVSDTGSLDAHIVQCVEGNREYVPCGEQNEGKSYRFCREGQWTEYTPCDIPNECESLGQRVLFYTGVAETRNVGECAEGIKECVEREGRQVYEIIKPEVLASNELCNNKDDDCDGRVDNGYNVGSDCSIGEGQCQREGRNVCSLDGLATICDAEIIQPQREECNGLDDDCNGEIDEGILGIVQNYYDGPAGTANVGLCREGQRMCANRNGEVGYITITLPILPVNELCNTLDDDCNGVIDNGYNIGAACFDGEEQCLAQGTIACAENGLETICADQHLIQPREETCNGVDDDCNNEIDENLRCGLIVFERDGDIYTMTGDGRDELNLTQTPNKLDFDPQWSPDGEKILYHSRDLGAGNIDLNVMGADGENKQQLTQPQRGFDDSLYGRWSPDGSMIAFISEMHQVPGDRYELYLMDSDGQNQQRVAPHNIGGQPDVGLVWAPNGLNIVLVTKRGCDGGDLAIYTPQSGELEFMTPCLDRISRYEPTVSPDSQSIIYITRTENRGDDRYDLTKLSINNGQEIGLLDGGLSPTYSPNGQLIALIGVDRDLYTINPDGGELERITQDAQAVRSQAMWGRVTSVLLNNSSLSWSPDNQELLFTSQQDGNYEVYKVNIETGILQRLTEHDGIDMSAQFQPIGH